MKRRTIYVILGLILLAAVGGVVVWRSRISRDSQNQVARSAQVQRGSMIVAVTAAGRIEPAARVGLSFEAPGRVGEVLVEEGERVERDQPLARLIADQLELDVSQSRAALAAAESQLAQLRAGPRLEEIEQARADLQAVEAQLNAAVANRNQLTSGPTDAEIAAAKAQVVQANTEMEIAQDTYDLIKEDGTEKEHANYDLYVAKENLAAAQARLDDVLSGAGRAERRAAESNVAAAEAQRDAAEAQLERLLAGPSEEDIAESQAQVEQSKIALRLAEHALERATLRAPFEGIVTEINMVPGETPPAQQAPLLLVDTSGFHMTVAVDELDVSQLSRGQEVNVTIEALADTEINGMVSTISPVATDETGVVAYDVDIQLDATEPRLRADMSANATIIVENLDDVLKVPSWAVRIDRDTGMTYVHRRTGDRIERVDVALGARQDGVVQVVSGLSEGDEVVRLEDGSSFELGSS